MQLWIQPLLAFLEGIALIASPCILPILPFILAGTITADKHRPWQIVAGFILGFTFFALASRHIFALTGIHTNTLQQYAYLMLLLFGLILFIPKPGEYFTRIASKIPHINNLIQQNQNGIILGMLIGIIWIPCAGPIMAIALVQVIQAQTTVTATLIILAFALGAGVPMLIIGYFSNFIKQYIKQFASHSELIRKIMGLIIICFSLFGLWGINIAMWWPNTSSSAVIKLPPRQLINSTMYYKAPEITGIAAWINSPPLTIKELRGKVILLDFWTYSCINCIRTLPHLKAWHERYAKDGLVIIGIHAPEFPFEQQYDNVQAAVQKFGITYPVALDNNFITWRNYHNQYWPAHYLINQNGEVVYTHFGEGEYAITEHNIRTLLQLDKAEPALTEKTATAYGQTPEIYLGHARQTNRTHAANLPLHHWRTTGPFKEEAQYLESAADNNTLSLRFFAKHVYLVMEATDHKPHTVIITDSNQQKKIIVNASELYEVANLPQASDATITLTFPQGIRIYAFTFGSN